MPVNNIDSWAPTQLYRSGIWGLGPGIWMFKANASPAWGLGLAPSRPRPLAPGGEFRRWSRGASAGGARSRFRLRRGEAEGAKGAERGVNRKSAAGSARCAGGGNLGRPTELQLTYEFSLPTLCSSSWWVELPRSELGAPGVGPSGPTAPRAC